MRACFNFPKEGCFYAFGCAFLLVFCNQIVSMYLMRQFPSVITQEIPFPPNQILELPRLSIMSVADDAIHFVLLLPINQ